MGASDIVWAEEVVDIGHLRPYERNPRTITPKQFDKLKESIQQDGYHSRIKVTHDYKVVGGHQRLKALKALGFDKVNVLVPSRELTDEEFHRILIRDNHNNGIFDMDGLANSYDLDFLHDMGLHEVNHIRGIGMDEEYDEAPPKRQVKCPQCENVFPVKGNAA